MYLGACPKGKDKTSTRIQPFSDIEAMQRAFCYKLSYMTMLVRKYIANEKVEKVVKKSLKNETFEDYIINIIKKYYGKTDSELSKQFNVTTSAKNKYSMLIKFDDVNYLIAKQEEQENSGPFGKLEGKNKVIYSDNGEEFSKFH